MALVIKALAVLQACSKDCPLASSALKQAEKVQPVPWVCGVLKRGLSKTKDSVGVKIKSWHTALSLFC